jgi:hypothetical protein
LSVIVEIPEKWMTVKTVKKTPIKNPRVYDLQQRSVSVVITHEPVGEMLDWLIEHADRYFFYEEPDLFVARDQKYHYFVKCLTEADAVLFRVRFELV